MLAAGSLRGALPRRQGHPNVPRRRLASSSSHEEEEFGAERRRGSGSLETGHPSIIGSKRAALQTYPCPKLSFC